MASAGQARPFGKLQRAGQIRATAWHAFPSLLSARRCSRQSGAAASAQRGWGGSGRTGAHPPRRLRLCLGLKHHVAVGLNGGHPQCLDLAGLAQQLANLWYRRAHGRGRLLGRALATGAARRAEGAARARAQPACPALDVPRGWQGVHGLAGQRLARTVHHAKQTIICGLPGRLQEGMAQLSTTGCR